MLALRTEISSLKTAAGSLVSSLQEVNASAVENQRDLKKAKETVAVTDFHQKSLTDKV